MELVFVLFMSSCGAHLLDKVKVHLRNHEPVPLPRQRRRAAARKRLVRHENIPVLPTSDWSVMKIYPCFRKLSK
eukprot:425003-Pyramimonas_sp.AAC.1